MQGPFSCKIKPACLHTVTSSFQFMADQCFVGFLLTVHFWNSFLSKEGDRFCTRPVLIFHTALLCIFNTDDLRIYRCLEITPTDIPDLCKFMIVPLTSALRFLDVPILLHINQINEYYQRIKIFFYIGTEKLPAAINHDD